MKMKKVVLVLVISLLLCGCVKINEETMVTSGIEETELIENETITEVADEEETDMDESDVSVYSKEYLESEDYKKLIGSVSELVYMSYVFQLEEAIQEQSPEAVMYFMDYAFSAYSHLPISNPARILGDPNGKITSPDSGLTCYTLPEEDVFWVFRNVFGWNNMTLSEFRKIEFLEEGLWSNYYVKDGLVYYYSEDESWVSWGEEFVAGTTLSNGDMYFKVKAYDIYKGDFDFFIVAHLKETVKGDRFWQFIDADFEPMSIGMEGSEIVYINQPFDDSFEDAYVAYLLDIVSGKQTVDGITNQYSIRFMPVYINDDEIPEVLLSSDASHVSPACLLAYIDGEVKCLGIYGSFGGLEYLEREGKICSSYLGMGQEAYCFYEFDGKNVIEVSTVNQTMEEVESTMGAYYYINGIETTKKEVQSFLDKERYSKYTVTKYDDYYGSDVISIAAVLKKYDGVAEDTKLEWIKSGETVSLPENLFGEALIEETKEIETSDENARYLFTGSFEDSYSQRAHMDIVENGDGTFCAEINWGDSAWENSTWTMSGKCVFDKEQNVWVIAYEDCKEVHTVYDDAGNVTENVIYENGSGMLYLDENQSVLWQDENYTQSWDCVFVKIR